MKQDVKADQIRKKTKQYAISKFCILKNLSEMKLS